MFTKTFRPIFEVIQVTLPFNIHFSRGSIMQADFWLKDTSGTGPQCNIEFFLIVTLYCILA